MAPSDPLDPLAAFDDDLIASVAEEYDRSTESLVTLLRRHQEAVRALPGVDNIVYEWRKAFRQNPIVERRPDAYYLLVEANVWPEFGAALSLDTASLRALRTVHARQLVAATGQESTADREPMVLTRP